MRVSDFRDYGITDFKPAEITRTGSRVSDVQLQVMTSAQAMRERLGRRVKPISFTGGKHSANSYHYLGRAMDFVLYAQDGEIVIADVFKAAVNAAYNGVGIYWNGKMWSFHVDTRSAFGFWSATKKKGQRKWTYFPLSLDPGYYKIKRAA